MNKVRVLLALAMIAGLLLVVALPSYAVNPDHGRAKDKDKPANHQNQPKHDKGGQQSPDATAEGMAVICHKPLTPAEQTLQVAESAVPGHLGHGDAMGPCLEVTPSATPTDTVPITNTDTITLCHKPGTPAEKVLVLPASAGPGHLRHGDYMGPCEAITPTVTPTATITPTVTPTATAGVALTNTEVITICHKPGTMAEQTLVVDAPAWPAHERHGDELGGCLEAPGGDDTAAAAEADYPRQAGNKR